MEPATHVQTLTPEALKPSTKASKPRTRYPRSSQDEALNAKNAIQPANQKCQSQIRSKPVTNDPCSQYKRDPNVHCSGSLNEAHTDSSSFKPLSIFSYVSNPLPARSELSRRRARCSPASYSPESRVWGFGLRGPSLDTNIQQPLTSGLP